MFQESGNSFMDKVSNLSDQPLLSAATHPDTNPTPPHISQKVVSLCHSSTHKCVYVMQHLVELASNNSKSLLSRIKAVRLMQELVLKGDPTFQQLLQKEEHRLKPVGNFLDQRNPFESSRLREAVSDLLEVLFEENSLPVPSPFSPLSSLSSLSSLPSPPPNLGLSRPVYQGFGNPYFPSNRPSSTGPGFSSGFSPGFSSGSGSGVINQVSGKVSEILSRVPPPDPNRFVGNQPEFGQRGGSGSQYAQNDTFYPGLRDGNFRSYQQPQLPATNQHIPGVVGASWSSGGEAPIGGERTGNGTEEERGLGHLERGLVVEFVSVGGVRGKPTRQEVEELLVRSKSLDTQQLVSHTISHLESQTGVSKLKCLFLLEALYHNSPNILAPILTPHSQVFQDVAESGESQSLRNKARDFLSLLGISVPSPDPTPSQSDDLIETDTPSQSDDLIETDTVPDSLEAGGEEGSLFNGMLTSQESKLSESQPLISGLEDLTIPDNSTNLIGSDMIELGNTEKSFSFDPLLDTSHTSTTISTNQTISTSFLPSNNSFLPSNNSFLPSNNSFLPSNNSLLSSNNSLLSSNNSFIQSNNSFIQSNNSISIQISIPQPHSLIPINSRPAPQIDLKSEERKDSFGFISEHIRTLKDSKN